MNEQHFPDYVRSTDWIQQYVFPGAELASVAEILRSTARVTSLSLEHLEEIGPHYARTLHHWRERFLARRGEVRSLGFDERFLRTWDYYLAYCEGAFAERYIGDTQLLFRRGR
jgi:cyclopropane-fatty-acyl-phospholipid synthase